MLKRLLTLLIPALILAALIALNRAEAFPRTTITGDENSLLYAAAFDGDADLPLNREWEQYEGRLEAHIVDGVLRVSVSDEGRGAYSLTTHRFRDFDVRAETRALEGPLDNGYGILFRLRDRRNYYLFYVSSDGYYQVSRVVDGEAEVLSAWITTATANPELNGVTVNTGLNVVNTVRVVATGNTFAFYVNDRRASLCIPNDPAGISTYYEFFDTPEERCVQGSILDTLTDDSHAEGQLGVFVESNVLPEGERGVTVEFDNLVVFGMGR